MYPKFLASIALLSTAVFVALVANGFRHGKPDPALFAENQTIDESSNSISNGFISPLISANTPEAPTDKVSLQAANNSDSREVNPSPKVDVVGPDLGEIDEIVPKFIDPQPYLSLPRVASSDLVIDQSGLTSARELIDYVGVHGSEFALDPQKVAQFMQASDPVPPSPWVLVEDRLANKRKDIGIGIQAYQEVLNKKIAFEKQIKVTGAAAEANKLLVGIDIATLQMLEEATRFEAGIVDKTVFAKFFQNQKAIKDFYYNQKLGAMAGLSVAFPEQHVGATILKSLGFYQVAHALGLPLGGPVILQTICTCSGVAAITVGPPRGGNFAYSLGVLLYLNYMPTVGHYVLGLYAPNPAPCLQIAVPSCLPNPVIPAFQGIITMMGTS